MKTIKTLRRRGALILVMLCITVKSFGQAQEIEQLILNIEKLTQFKAILSDMKTGYQIYQQGYGAISGISKGNFDLHNVFLSGLLAVSPTVRNYARVADIISQQARLVSEYKRNYHNFRQSGSFSVDELAYMSNVYSKLINQSLNDLDELATILTAGQLRMSDAERLQSIDRLYAGSSDQLNFLRKFNRQGILLSLQRTKDVNDIQTLKNLYK
ncbi:TerB family tellurite resistance protein [Mucilaginibacter calamicampi]|uniref:TerB family tellurite resistance protein n=1 Tax=Mucilaginibacter calamicampi TaxID=1302352 RepID=A0ABW2YX73_9SPHI